MELQSTHTHSLNGRGSDLGSISKVHSLLQVATSLIGAEASTPVVVGHVSPRSQRKSKQITFHHRKMFDKFHLRTGSYIHL